MLRVVFILPITLLSACATIVNGSSQTVTLSTSPAGATCTIDRMGTRIGAVSPTPGSVRLDKSKNDLVVTCGKAGYQTATVTKPSSFGVATLGNVIAGGVIGLVVDAASGASYEYPGDIRLDLAANPGIALPLAQAPYGTSGVIYAAPPYVPAVVQPAVVQPIGASSDPAASHRATY